MEQSKEQLKAKQKEYKNKSLENFKMIMIRKEVHEQLKAYCDHHGYKMSALVSNLIKKELNKK